VRRSCLTLGAQGKQWGRLGIFTSKAFALHVAMLALLLDVAGGSSYNPVSLRRCVAGAGVIAAGTVESITPRSIEGTIVSEIRFRDVAFLRDSRSTRRSLVIHLLGGSMGDSGLVDMGGPTFRAGERYVLLLKTSLGTYRDGYSPIIYYNQGLFPVFPDSPSAQPSVHNWIRRPIAGVHGGRIISVQPRDENSAPTVHRRGVR